MDICIAEFRYGSAALSIATVERETDKMYFLRNVRDILKWNCVSAIRKGDPRVFLTLRGALLYLAHEAEEYVGDCKIKLNKAREQFDMLTDIADSQEKAKKLVGWED